MPHHNAASPRFLTSLDQAPLELACHLVRYPSVTPDDAGCLWHLHTLFQDAGWDSHHVVFSDTTNLFTRWGKGGPHLCFVGHVDVVPPGPLDLWTFPPFEPTVHDGKLYGRGIADMKGAVACFVTAAMQYVRQSQLLDQTNFGSISILLTSDEEGTGIHGIQKMIPWLESQRQVPDVILIGEPTGTHTGEVVQVGRRGSVTGELLATGKQGHIAYPHLADNPLPRLVRCLQALMDLPLDDGNAQFEPSRLEITSIDVGNPTTNIIPRAAQARFGIRFNPLQTPLSLGEQLESVCQHHLGPDHELRLSHHGNPFYNRNPEWLACVHNAVRRVTGKDPTHTTQGGTTDGRFLNALAPVLEVGLPETTIHQIDEHVAVQDLAILHDLYAAILRSYFTAGLT